MKTIILSVIAIAIALPSFAQWNPATGGIYYNDGNVGIGTTSPNSRLDVVGAIRVAVADQGVSGISLANNNVSFNNSLLYGYTVRSASADFKLLDLRTNDGNTNTMYIDGNGNAYIAVNVGIGTTSPDQKLTVNGAIHSTEVKVTPTVPVPDYVFEKTYKLINLTDLKSYLDANHHLPEIPSARS